jgi:hypothetical protein
MKNVSDPSTIPYLWVSRLLLAMLIVIGLILIRRAWSGRDDA